MELDVDGDFKKSRAFLVAFSTAVLLMWYFSADLKAINIIGYSIKIKENAHDLWLVIAVINIYFLLRFIQRFPSEARSPDDAMRLAFERTLIGHMEWAYSNFFFVKVSQFERMNPSPKPIGTLQVLAVFPRGEMKYRQEHRAQVGQKQDAVETLRRRYGHRVVFAVPFRYLTEYGGIGVSSAHYVEIVPNPYAVLYAQILGFLRGVVFTPWMSEYILPVFLGLLGVIVALYSWGSLNCWGSL